MNFIKKSLKFCTKLLDHYNINQLGWTGVKHQAMTELCFAFEKLDGVIPLALNSGMGRPSIRRLRLWLNEVKRYIVWLNDNHNYQILVDDIERLYFTVLTKFDDDIEPINLDDFYQSFIFQLQSFVVQVAVTYFPAINRLNICLDFLPNGCPFSGASMPDSLIL